MMMASETLRDRLWLWGMKVNVLQESSNYGNLGFGPSKMTTEDAIQRTGIPNVLIAGHLEIEQVTLDSIPSARRFICKSALHTQREGKHVPNVDVCMAKLRAAQELAKGDDRIDRFLVDDFSTGSIDSGIRRPEVDRLVAENAAGAKPLELGATIYTMSLDRPELPELLPPFGHYLVPLWHAEQIDTLEGAVDRLGQATGGKPMILCLYLFDFGEGQLIPRDLMQRQLDAGERMVTAGKVEGLCILGTCMMDLDWEANACFYDWLDSIGDRKL
jgi:hypothetical protein